MRWGGCLYLSPRNDSFPYSANGMGLKLFPWEEAATLHLTRLPHFHKDLIDRMLVCQALTHGLVILTPDELILQYPVRTEW